AFLCLSATTTAPSCTYTLSLHDALPILQSHYQYFHHLIEGDGDGAAPHEAFYDEYLSVCDLTAEFYLQTVEHVFKEHSLPKGTRSEEHTSELQSRENLVCRLLLEKKKQK